MCGIAGYLTDAPAAPDTERLGRLLHHIRERGPDGEGLCLIAGAEGRAVPFRTDRSPSTCAGLPDFRDRDAWFRHDLAIAHSRYAVIDRSDDSHQPFVSASSDIVLAFQGEIFNYVELRRQLESIGHAFRTSSDTEVLVQAYREWGDGAWPKLNGFWSAAVYDRRAHRLVLCRDRLGIAPLYVARTKGALFFGSSPLGMASMLTGGARPRRSRVSEFVETGLRDFDQLTLFEDVCSVPPGTFRSFDFHTSEPGVFESRSYWDLPDQRLSEHDLSIREASDALRETLTSAVEYRLRADRPIAFQLSGGMDSTSVIAVAATLRADPLPTYTVSVPEEDEEPITRTMERRFRLERSVLRGLERGMLEDPVSFARLMAEPVQAPSAYAHHAMCLRMKSDGFGVTLSGSGGDEVLAGYEWDFWPAAKRVLREGGHHVQVWMYQLFLEFGSLERAAGSASARIRRALTAAGRAGKVDPVGLAEAENDPADGAQPEVARALLRRFETLPYDERRKYHLRAAHLPYYLASNDRATLGIPLEHRQPFLDHRLVELGLRMPPSYLFRRGWTKYVLRRAMAPFLPKEIVWRRKKVGFPFPVQRLVTEARPVLESAARTSVREGFGGAGWPGFDVQLERDSGRFWRTCSVGLWLQALE